MLPSFNDYLHSKNLRDRLISFRDIDDQNILQFDWSRGRSSLDQPKVVVSDAAFLWWVTPCKKKKLRYHSFLSRDFDDQRILQSEWTRGITGHFQPKEKVPDATLACWLPPYKKTKRLLDFFQRYQWSKNPPIWLEKRHNWAYPTKRGSLRCYLSFMIVSIQKI